MPRLLELLSSRLGLLIYFAELSRPLQILQTSLKRCLALLQATYLIHYLPSWSSNVGKRLIKMPKLYFTVPGLASYLLGTTAEQLKTGKLFSGQMLENFVRCELPKQAA